MRAHSPRAPAFKTFVADQDQTQVAPNESRPPAIPRRLPTVTTTTSRSRIDRRRHRGWGEPTNLTPWFRCRPRAALPRCFGGVGRTPSLAELPGRGGLGDESAGDAQLRAAETAGRCWLAMLFGGTARIHSRRSGTTSLASLRSLSDTGTPSRRGRVWLRQPRKQRKHPRSPTVDVVPDTPAQFTPGLLEQFVFSQLCNKIYQ